jgi:hypothetical protein
MPKPMRIVLRLEISPGVPEALDLVVKRVGSTNVSVCSRVINWLCTQDDVLQAGVLGLYPPGVQQPDVSRLVLQRLAKGERPSGFRG